MEPFRTLFVMAIVGGCFAKHSAADESVYVQHQNAVYGEVHGIGLVMDVFTPKDKSNGLGVIDVISGDWHSDRGKIGDHAQAQTFDILCKKGYTVFAVRPGSITKFSVAEMLENLNRGIVWVKNHADDYRIDPDRLGMMGASAGGHLACLAAVTAQPKSDSKGTGQESDTRVRALAVFFPPTDFLDYGGKTSDPRSDNDRGKLIRALAFPHGVESLTDAEVAENLTRISPARLVTKHSPPFLLIHGDADRDVPLQQSERMVAALKDAGVPVELIVKPGGGHPWLTIHEEVAVLADWFDKQLASE
jgi:acetyl esterase/lipase